jgi:hypothetical protein
MARVPLFESTATCAASEHLRKREHGAMDPADQEDRFCMTPLLGRGMRANLLYPLHRKAHRLV